MTSCIMDLRPLNGRNNLDLTERVRVFIIVTVNHDQIGLVVAGKQLKEGLPSAS